MDWPHGPVSDTLDATDRDWGFGEEITARDSRLRLLLDSDIQTDKASANGSNAPHLGH